MASYTQQQITDALNNLANTPSSGQGFVAEFEAYATELVNRVSQDYGMT